MIVSYGLNDSTKESISDAEKKLSNKMILEIQRWLYNSSLYSFLCEMFHKIKRGMKLKNSKPKYIPEAAKVSLKEYRENLERIVYTDHWLSSA